MYAAGHAERGNDIPVLLSTTKAERVDGGYRFTGHKFFGSLTPVWTFLGVHGLDTSDPKAPKVVHAFMPRATEGYSIKDTWDVLGMRATGSQDTVLEGVFVPDDTSRASCRLGSPASTSSSSRLPVGADRASGTSTTGCRAAPRPDPRSVKRSVRWALARSMMYHPAVQHGIAEMAMEVEAIGPYLDRIADDWTNGVDHGGPGRRSSAPSIAPSRARGSCRSGARAAGGFGIFAASGSSACCAMRASAASIRRARRWRTRSSGSLTLGINPDEQPRWG